MNLGFFKFQPYLKSVLWGGERIAKYKGIVTDQKQIGESWEISGVTGRESVVCEGADLGLTIVELIRKYKGALVGAPIYAKYGDTFPILVKFLDAREDLSLQVHPNDTIAKNRSGERIGRVIQPVRKLYLEGRRAGYGGQPAGGY